MIGLSRVFFDVVLDVQVKSEREEICFRFLFWLLKCLVFFVC
jgi:hypothetical protein